MEKILDYPLHTARRIITTALLALVLIGALAISAKPAAAVTVGNHQVNFITVRNDYPSAGVSTWYYTVISGRRPAISHVVFQLNLNCLHVVAAGTWNGTNQNNLTQNGGNPEIGRDPTTNVTGIKFDQEFNDNETRHYYITVNGNYAQEQITIAAKAGPGFSTALITGPSLTCAPSFTPAPAIDIEKYTNGEDADAAPGPQITEGQPVNWTYVVVNTGNVALSNIVVTDDKGVAVTCPSTSLAVGANMTCTGSGTATLGQYTNIGSVTGSYNGTNVSDSDPSNYFGVPAPAPAIDIKKYTNGEDADTAPGPQITEGQPVNWTYVVVNTGNVALSNIVVTDDKGVAVTCPSTSLAVGANMTCTGSGTAGLGQYTNIGSVTGSYNGTNVSDSDPSNYFGVPAPAPAIDIKKYTNGEDADAAPGPQITQGQPVNWTYVVVNTGNVALSNIVVTDDKGVAVTCPSTSLAVGANMTCTGSGTAGLGQYTNIGSVTGSYNGTNVSDSDPSNYFGVPAPAPAIDIKKYTNGEDADTAPGPQITQGQPVNWTYVVVNTGNVALSNIVVTDDKGVVVSCPSTSLAVGANMTCTGSGTAGLGQYTNIGSVTGSYNGTNVSDSDPSNYFGVPPFTPNPAIDIKKYTNGEDADVPTGPLVPIGSPVVWTYVVTNIGNVPLANITVGDDKIGVICVIPSLAPGQSQTCTANGTATAGQYANVGKVAGCYNSAVPSCAGGTKVTDEDKSHYFGQ
jgi:uncharacterized repeat protein (TIGR01451 family)